MGLAFQNTIEASNSNKACRRAVNIPRVYDDASIRTVILMSLHPSRQQRGNRHIKTNITRFYKLAGWLIR
jgi:hypothetical protein